MLALDTLAAALAVGLAIYLLIALLSPERLA